MRTTVDLDEDLLSRAIKESGIHQKTALLEEGLRLIVAQCAQRRMAILLDKGPGFSKVLVKRNRERAAK
jgi:Arc/MetJ family transcription regulator